MTPGSLRLRLIGRPALLSGEATLRLPTRKTLALLAVLALSVQRQGRGAIAALLWPRLDAAAGRRNLRRELHRLRAAGLAAAVADDGDTLVLGSAVEVDARAFRAACAGGDSAAAAECGAGALLDGFAISDGDAFDEWAQVERSRHREQWADAAEREAATLRRAGRVREALALLERLCGPLGVDPLRETAVREAMSCEAVLGEGAAALRRHERFARALHDELGLAPLPATQALAAQLRSGSDDAAASGGDPARAGAKAARADPLPAHVPFIGRDDAIRAMQAAWSRGRVIVVGGEPGCGKTRLASDFAAAAGPFALVACRPADAAIAYATATRALRALLGDGRTGELAPWVRDELARLLPEIGPSPSPIASPEERARFVAAFTSAWHGLLDGDFRSLLIDDWQYADEASIDLFLHLAQAAGEAGAGRDDGAARLFIASRPLPTEAHGGRALQHLVDAGLAERIELAPLDAAELLTLVQRLSGSAGAQRFAARLHRATGGNPLFAIQTLRHLFETGLLSVADDGTWQTPFDDDTRDYHELPVPSTVRDTVLARVRGLGEAAWRLLEAASLAGDPFSMSRLEGTTALGEFERVEAIERALAAHLLVVDDRRGDGGDGPRYRHAHDLIAQSVAETISPERARLLHRRLAASAVRLALPAERIASHLQAAGDRAAAHVWRLRAAADAQARYAHAEALGQLSLALHPALPARERIAVQLRRAALARQLLDRAEAERALADAERHATREASAHAAVVIALAQHALAGQDFAAAIDRLDAVVDDPRSAAEDRAEARLTRAMALQRSGDGRADGELEAVVAASPAAASQRRARAFMLLGNSALRRGEWAAAGRWFARGADDAEAIGDLANLAAARMRRGTTLSLQGDFAAATGVLEQALADAARAGHIGHQRGAILNLVKVGTQTGQLERAAELLQRGMALSPQFSAPAEETAFHQSAYYVAYLRGELGEAFGLAERVVAHADGLADIYWQVGARVLVLDLALLVGDHDRAARWLAQAQQADHGRVGGYHRALLVAKAAWLALERGDADAAATEFERFNHAAGAEADDAPISGEDALVVDHVRARVLLAQGRIDAAWSVVAADAPRLSLDAWTLRAAARLAVARSRGDAGLADLEALRRLRDDVVAERLPPLEAQRLGGEIAAAFIALGLPRDARRLHEQLARRRQVLDAHLADAGYAGLAVRSADPRH